MRVQFRTFRRFKMALDIPNHREIFGQGDVRETETPASSKLTGTLFWSCPGNNFIALNPDTDSMNYSSAGGEVITGANGITFTAPVFLPHGAVINSVVVNGTATDETWDLRRVNNQGSSGSVASGNIGTTDTSITNETVDNENRSYLLVTSSLDTGDQIDGAFITYTI